MTAPPVEDFYCYLFDCLVDRAMKDMYGISNCYECTDFQIRTAMNYIVILETGCDIDEDLQCKMRDFLFRGYTPKYKCENDTSVYICDIPISDATTVTQNTNTSIPIIEIR